MAGIAVSVANAALEGIRSATPHVQLHIGEPGAAGTTNKATELTRKPVTFGAPVGGVMSNTAQVQWTNIAGAQDATHFSIFDSLGDGTGVFKFSGTVAANAYLAGDTYTAAIGAITLTIAVAA